MMTVETGMDRGALPPQAPSVRAELSGSGRGYYFIYEDLEER